MLKLSESVRRALSIQAADFAEEASNGDATSAEKDRRIMAVLAADRKLVVS